MYYGQNWWGGGSPVPHVADLLATAPTEIPRIITCKNTVNTNMVFKMYPEWALIWDFSAHICICCKSTRSFRRQILGVIDRIARCVRVRRERGSGAPRAPPARPLRARATQICWPILAVAPHGNWPAIEPTNTTCPLRIGPSRKLPAG